jgi:WhiB family redox-sensing transcriptional regulator
MEKDNWLEQAACRGKNTALFFPAQNSMREYRKICAKCPVRSQCLELGMSEALGIWGGVSGRERRTIRIKRRIPA